MTNLEKADELYPYYEDMTDLETFQIASRRTGFIAGAEWKEQQMIDKACEWLKDNANDYLDWYDWEQCRVDKDELVYDFKKAMEE